MGATEAYSNHTYKIERQGQSSVQNELRLKLYHACAAEPGQAPTSLEARRRPNMKGAIRQREREKLPEEIDISTEFPAVPEPTSEAATEPGPPVTEPAAEPAVATEPRVAAPEPAPPVATGRPSRVTKRPIRFGDYECYPCEAEPNDAGIVPEDIQQREKMSSQKTGAEPAASRVSVPPPQPIKVEAKKKLE